MLHKFELSKFFVRNSNNSWLQPTVAWWTNCGLSCRRSKKKKTKTENNPNPEQLPQQLFFGSEANEQSSLIGCQFAISNNHGNRRRGQEWKDPGGLSNVSVWNFVVCFSLRTVFIAETGSSCGTPTPARFCGRRTRTFPARTWSTRRASPSRFWICGPSRGRSTLARWKRWRTFGWTRRWVAAGKGEGQRSHARPISLGYWLARLDGGVFF